MLTAFTSLPWQAWLVIAAAGELAALWLLSGLCGMNNRRHER